MWHMYDGMFFGMHFLWWIFFIIVLIWLFATPNNIIQHRFEKDSPIDILKKRFARGEITREEYEERRRVLEQG